MRAAVARWVGWVAAALALAVLPATAADRTPRPVIEPAAGGQCVEPADQMRRNHMVYLKHQRDDTVRGGVRGARHSLKGCIDCHASRQTASVNQADSNFCVSCHRYAAVRVDCFDCHTGTAAKLAQGAAK